jgi:tRNA (Thr-GGU) A37 N-methylase
MEKKEFKMSPVGYVRKVDGGFCLEIEKEYIPALKGMEGFNYINVFWWCHFI